MALEREVQLHTHTQADKQQAQQQAEELRERVTAAESELQAARAQLAHVPRPMSPLLQPNPNYASAHAPHHPLQSVLGEPVAQFLVIRSKPTVDEVSPIHAFM